MPLNLPQMVWDLNRRVEQLEQDLSNRLPHPARWPEPPAPQPKAAPQPGGERAEIVLRAVHQVFGASPAALRSSSGADAIMPAAKAAALLLFEHHFSNREIGRILGDRSGSNAGYLRRQAAGLPKHLIDSARQRAQELAQ